MVGPARAPKNSDVVQTDQFSVPFDYNFADQQYALKFAAEERIWKVAGFFTLLAIFNLVLGLFGNGLLHRDSVPRKLGVRKVAGRIGLRHLAVAVKGFLLLVLLP